MELSQSIDYYLKIYFNNKKVKKLNQNKKLNYIIRIFFFILTTLLN